jgi:transcriptional regulator with XRE-family HTH domain
MTVNEAFKLRVETYLKENKISIHKFIKDGLIARSTLVNLLNGVSKSPTLTTLFQVANAMGMTVIEFLDCDIFKNNDIDF